MGPMLSKDTMMSGGLQIDPAPPFTSGLRKIWGLWYRENACWDVWQTTPFKSDCASNHGASMVDLGHIFSDFSSFKSDFFALNIVGFDLTQFSFFKKKWWPKDHTSILFKQSNGYKILIAVSGQTFTKKTH
jgi:hypothetical protein